jgi:hypothetical protein
VCGVSGDIEFEGSDGFGLFERAVNLISAVGNEPYDRREGAGVNYTNAIFRLWVQVLVAHQQRCVAPGRSKNHP